MLSWNVDRVDGSGLVKYMFGVSIPPFIWFCLGSLSIPAGGSLSSGRAAFLLASRIVVKGPRWKGMAFS